MAENQLNRTDIFNKNWNLDDIEKRRILSLHESATKKQYLISEQNVNNSLQLPVNFNFNMGFWSENAKDPKTKRNIKQQIQLNLKRISEFLKANKNSNIIVSIETGESKIPNVDRESGSNEKVESGYLAKKRAETIKKELKSFFETLVSNKLLKRMPTFTEPIYVQGKETSPGTKATEEQFAKAVIKVDTYCLTGLVIGIGYFQSEVVRSGRKCHTCERARFQILINDVPLKVFKRDKESAKETDEYIANLNNVPSDYEKLSQEFIDKGKDPSCIGGDRFTTFRLSQEEANKINKTGDNLRLEMKCVGTKVCHSDVPKIWIAKEKYDKSGYDFYYKGFPNTSGAEMKEGDKKLLLILDKCGDPLEFNQ